MKSSYIFVIIFLFVSYTNFSVLFAAHDSKMLCVKYGSALAMENEKIDKEKEAEKEQYTVELKKLFKTCCQAKDKDTVWCENSPMMEKCIKMGASSDISDGDDFLLHKACFYNCPNLVETCLANGALMERTDRCKKTALFFCKTVRLLEIFLKYGANFNHKSECKDTALDYAMVFFPNSYSVEAVEFLSRHTMRSLDKSGRVASLYGLCNFGYQKKYFGSKAAILLWWWQDQEERDKEVKEVSLNYLKRWYPDFSRELDEIGKEVKQAQFPGWQNNQLIKMVNKFIPNVPNVGDIVHSYSGPPLSDISLRCFLQEEEEASKKYPAITQAFSHYVEPVYSVKPAELKVEVPVAK